MIFIIRAEAGRVPPLAIKMVRQTPDIVPDSNGLVDFFCLGDGDAAASAGWQVVPVHDGWYADDMSGGMAIWGQGMFWEVRDTPFNVRQASGPEAWPTQSKHGQAKHDQDSALNVRQAIFQG